ncbi:MAG: cytochrome P450 [Pseudomonadota bacterium]
MFGKPLKDDTTDGEAARPGIDLLSREVAADPYPTYAWLRDKHPVCRVEPGGIWAVSRFEDVQFVLDNPDIFSASAANALYNTELPEDERTPARLISSQDPPDHGKYQGLVNKAFLDKATKPLIPLMLETAQSLLGNFNTTTPLDFVEHFTYPFVRTIIDRIVGLEDHRQDPNELREWLLLEERVSLSQTDETFNRAFDAATARQNRYFSVVMNERRKRPRDDLVTRLVTAEVDGRRLSDEEICGLLRLLVSAGFVTTVHMLSHAIVLLARKPDLFALLKDSPQSIPAFVEELLRFAPSVLATVRTTTRAVEIAGVEIPACETVLPIVASANRDPSAFPNPDRFDLARPRNGRHLSFGYGVHTCLGAALARLELRIALEALLGSYTYIDCPPDDRISRVHTLFLHGISELPIRLY